MKMNRFIIVIISFFLYQGVSAQTRVGIRGGLNKSGLSGNYFDDSIDQGYENNSRTGYNIGFYVDIPVISNFTIQSGLYLTSKGNKLFYENSTTKETQRLNLDTYKYYDVKETKSNITEIRRQQTYLQVPILFTYRYELPFDVFVQGGLGPYFAYGLFGNQVTEQKTSTYVYPDKYGQNKSESKEVSIPSFGESDKDQARAHSERFDAGLSLLVAFGWKRINLGLSYDIGLRNTYLVPDFEGNSLYKGIPSKTREKIENTTLKTRNFSLTLGFEF